jgi:hypothetical protein
LDAVAKGCEVLTQAHGFEGRKDLSFSVMDARKLLDETARTATPANRLNSDLVSALICDGASKDEEAVRATPYCAMFGQGHQHFLERLETIPKGTPPKKLSKKLSATDLNSVEKLEQALFRPWLRIDATQSFRWDPLEDRRYALRFEDPSSDEALTVHGANRLASLALPLLTAVPIRERGKIQLNAAGARFVPGTGMCIFWPIWSRSATLKSVTSMLGTPTEALTDCEGLGVIRVYRAERISVGKYFNFTRASIV